MPYCHFAFPAGPTPPPAPRTRNFPQPWRSCHTQHRLADQLSQLSVYTLSMTHLHIVTMWPCLSQLSQLASCHVALHQCTLWFTLCNCLFFEQLWQMCLRMRGGVKKDSFSSFTHFPLYPFLVTVVTVDHLPCCNAPMHNVDHNVQLTKKEATVTTVPPHARGG